MKESFYCPGCFKTTITTDLCFICERERQMEINKKVDTCKICNNLMYVNNTNNITKHYCNACIDNYKLNIKKMENIIEIDENLPSINLSKEKSIKKEMTFTYKSNVTELDLSVIIRVFLNDRYIGYIFKTTIASIDEIGCCRITDTIEFTSPEFNLHLKFNSIDAIKKNLEQNINDLFKYIETWK